MPALPRRTTSASSAPRPGNVSQHRVPECTSRKASQVNPVSDMSVTSTGKLLEQENRIREGILNRCRGADLSSSDAMPKGKFDSMSFAMTEDMRVIESDISVS